MQRNQVTAVQCAARANKHIHGIASQETPSIESTNHCMKHCERIHKNMLIMKAIHNNNVTASQLLPNVRCYRACSQIVTGDIILTYGPDLTVQTTVCVTYSTAN